MIDRVFYLGEHFVELPARVDIALRALYHASAMEEREYCAGLFGKYSKDGTLVTIEGVLSVRCGEREQCARDNVSLTESCRRLWEVTSGELYLIGDWHTHPNASAEPSAIDLETLKASREAQLASPLLLISGISGYSLRGLIGDEILTGEMR